MPTVQARCGCGYLHPVRLSKGREGTESPSALSPHRSYGGNLFAEEHKVSLDTVSDLTERLDLREKELDAALAVIQQYEQLESKRKEDTAERDQLWKDKSLEATMLQDELDALRKYLKDSEDERLSLEANATSLQSQLSTLKLVEMKSEASMRQLAEQSHEHERLKHAATDTQARLSAITEQLHKAQLQLQVNNSSTSQENTSLKKQVQELQSRLHYADRVQAEHTDLLRAYNKLSEAHKASEKEATTLRALVEDLRKAADDAAFKQQELSETLEMVGPVQSEFQERIRQLGDAAAEAQHSLAQKEEELAELRAHDSEAGTLRTLLNEKESKLAVACSELASMRTYRTNTDIEHDGLQELVSRLHSDLAPWCPEDAHDEHAALIIALNRVKRSAVNDRAECEALSSELNGMQAKLKDSQDKLKQRNMEADQEEHSKEVLRSIFRRLSEIELDAPSRSASPAPVLALPMAQHMPTPTPTPTPPTPTPMLQDNVLPLIEKLMADAATTKVQLDELGKKYQRLEEAHAHKEEECVGLEEARTHKEKEVKQAVEEKRQAIEEKQQAVDEKQQAETKYEEARREFTMLESQLQEITALSVDSNERSELIRLRNETEVLEGDRLLLQEAMDKRDSQLHAVQMNLVALQGEISEARQTNHQLRTNLDDTRGDLERLTLREKATRDQTEKIQKEANESRDSIGLLMLQLSDSEKRESTMKSLLDEREGQLSLVKSSVQTDDSLLDRSPVQDKLHAVEEALVRLQEQRQDDERRLETEVASLKHERDAWADKARNAEDEVERLGTEVSLLQDRLQNAEGIPSPAHSSPMASPRRGKYDRDITMQGTPVLLDDLVLSPDMANLKERLAIAEREADTARRVRDAAELEQGPLPKTHHAVQDLIAAEDVVEKIVNTIRRKNELEVEVAKGHSPGIATRVQSLEQRLKGRNKSHNELLQENEALKIELSKAKKEAADAAVRVVVAAEDAHNPRLEELTEIIHERDNRLTALHDEINSREDALAEEQRKAAELLQRVNDTTADKEGLELQVNMVKKQLEKMTNSLKESEGTVRDKEAIIKQLHGVVRDAAPSSPTFGTPTKEQLKMIELEAENEMLHEQLAEIRTSKLPGSPLPLTPASSTKEFENLKSHNARLRNEYESLQNEHGALLADVGQLKDQVTDLQGSILDEQDGTDDLIERMHSYEDRLETELKSKMRAQKTIQILQEQNMIQQTQLAQRGATQRQRENIQQDVEELQQIYNEAITRTHQMEKEYAAGLTFFERSKLFDSEMAEKVVRAIMNSNRRLSKEEIHDVLHSVLRSDVVEEAHGDAKLEAALKQLEGELIALTSECDQRRPTFARSERVPIVKRLSLHFDGLMADLGMAGSGTPVGEATKIQALLSQETSRRRAGEATIFRLQQEAERVKRKFSKERELQRDVREMTKIIEELRLDNRNLREKVQDEEYEKKRAGEKLRSNKDETERAKRRIKDLEGKVKYSESEKQELERMVSGSFLSSDRLERRTAASSRASSRQASPSLMSRSPRPTPTTSPFRLRDEALDQEVWDAYS